MTLIDQFVTFLSDPSTFPSEFKNWIVKYIEANPPQITKGSVSGLNTLPASEIAYTEFTAIVNVTATTEATANTVVTAPAVTFDGASTVWVEFSSAIVISAAVGVQINLYLFDGTSQGFIGQVYGGASQVNAPVFVRRRVTPTAGSHTYSIRAQVPSGTGQVYAGAGGVGVVSPGYIRIVRA